MRRLQQGGVIPRLTPEEAAEERARAETFEIYHRTKAVGYRRSENNVKSRGGLGAKLKAIRMAQHRQETVV